MPLYSTPEKPLLNAGLCARRQGRVDEAAGAIERAAAHADPAPPAWTVAWLSGLVNRQQGRLEEAEANFRKVLEDRTEEMRKRGFDFSKDYEVRNLLGLTLYDRASQYRGAEGAEQRRAITQKSEMTIRVPLLGRLCTRSNRIAACCGCSRTQPCDARRPRREIEFVP